MKLGTSIDRADVSDRSEAAAVLSHHTYASWRILGVACIGLIVLGAAAMHIGLTWGGMGLSPDSVNYILIARGLDAGDGYAIRSVDGTVAAQSHWPPLYPLVLAGILRLGGAVPDAMIWVHAGLLALVLCLAAAIAHRVGNGSIAAAVVCTGVLASSKEMLAIHVMLVSEPLFLALLLSGILVMNRAFELQRLRLLVVAGVLMGLAWITRYAGVGAILVGVVCSVFFWRSTDWRRRLLAGCVYAACAMTPMMCWIVRGFLQTGAVGNRAIVWHPPGREALQGVSDTAAAWLVPGALLGRPSMGWAAVLVVALVASAWWLTSRSHIATTRRISTLLVIFAFGYFAFLMLSLTLFDAYTPLDYRTLLPVQALATPLVCGAFVSCIARPGKGRLVRGMLAAVVIAAIVVRIPAAVDWVRRAPAESLGYNSTGWRESTLMEAVRQLPTSPWIYSNRADAIVACTGRPAIQLPRRHDPTQLRPNPDLPDDLEKIAGNIRQRWAYVVILRRKGPEFLIDETELRTLGRLSLIGRHRQGAIYRFTAKLPTSAPSTAPASQ